MSAIFDNPAVGVVAVVLASVVLFVPTIGAHFRRIEAFRPVSARNVLTLFLVVCFLVPGWFFRGMSSALVLWSTMVIWVTSATWPLTGKRHDMPSILEVTHAVPLFGFLSPEWYFQPV
jgi:hypothetical protein